MKLRQISALVLFALVSTFAARAQSANRSTLSLNGTWQVEDGISADVLPQHYGHTVAVPGLTHSAKPAFKDVDEYQTRQLLFNLTRQGRYSKTDYAKLGDVRGITPQTRKYFWYHRTFTAPGKHAVALLKVNKAQFGISVYLNGVLLGEHAPCFTAAIFDATKAVKWNAENELVIRVGAHPGMLPDNVSAGTDFEKNRWTPGIYDDVSFVAANNPVISTIQIAPHIESSTITVQTVLHNYSTHAVTTTVRQQVRERVSHAAGSSATNTTVSLAAGASHTVLQTVHINRAHLWSPDDPFLYEVNTSTAGDSTTTRFGMREFRFDTATRRAYLNGKPFFMRGSNITLHRFFEDHDSGSLPWNEAWLHRLLVEIPKRMHWNSFRFCIGPVPDRWLEIADENGLLIQNEYFVWTGRGDMKLWAQSAYSSDEMISEYKEWMRDNWNHPSVVIWDATNESILPEFTEKIIPAVRGLDLSNRPWENSYNAPAGPDDPVEDHQYLYHRLDYKMQDMEQMMGPLPVGSTSKSAHANILNEYGWLWLNRDGTPTLLTDKLYPQLLAGKPNTTESRFALQNYLLSGETEFWRAYRHYAGVLHFVYLTASERDAFTSDHFEDVRTLTLNPGFEKSMEQAFNPLGVYLNFWQTSLTANATKDFTILMVNDESRQRTGTLRLHVVDTAGKELAATEHPFDLSALGAQSYVLRLQIPATEGDVSLEAVAVPSDDASHTITSHRITAIAPRHAQK